MRSMWLFRTNLRNLEYYHEFKTLDEFKSGCHDFYLMMGLYYLENNNIDEFIVWRLIPNNKQYTHIPNFTLPNGKMFRQEFVNSFEDIFKYGRHNPDISFFRGGFPEYCKLTKKYKSELGIKLYLGAGQRIYPQYGGVYDKLLVEDLNDYNDNNNCIPFYKTCNPNVFYMNQREPKYDICFIANFTQQSYKGQEFFIKEISKSKYLQSLDILFIGNEQKIGIRLCEKYKITNIHFLGYKSRTFINQIINKSKFGIVCSNKKDGCPRVITEILCCGTPLFIRDKTRLLPYYKKLGTIIFNDLNIENQIRNRMKNWLYYKKQAVENLERLSFKKICYMNLNLWKN